MTTEDRARDADQRTGTLNWETIHAAAAKFDSPVRNLQQSIAETHMATESDVAEADLAVAMTHAISIPPTEVSGEHLLLERIRDRLDSVADDATDERALEHCHRAIQIVDGLQGAGRSE